MGNPRYPPLKPMRPNKEDFSMTENQYRTKQEEVIAKFTKEFIKREYLQDPILNAIVQLLIRGADPYAIIEELIEQLKKVEELNMKLMQEGVRLPKI